MAKQLCFDADARESLKQGVLKLARAVKSTLGPRGRTAVIDRGWGGPNITKDGYTVADEIELKDPYENMGAQLLKEAASKTNDVSGDGTTTATVLAEAIYVRAMRFLTAGVNTAQLSRGIIEASNRVSDHLRGSKISKKVSLDQPEQLRQIAAIAANNDKELGDILIDAMEKVGANGVINIEEGKGTTTEVDLVEGMQFDRGYLSPHFVTDQKSLECEYRNCLVLIHEDKISQVKPLIPLLEKASKAKRPLLIIAEDIDGEALATLVVNKLRGVVDCVAVKAPGYGDRRKAMLQDIATLTGAQPVFKDTGVDVEQYDLTELGTAKKITITSDNTTIVEGGGSQKELKARVAQIRSEIETTESSYDREKLEERLAKLAGGVAQINVGAATETEMKEKKARIKDAQSAVQAALEEGILPGGGTALLRAADDVSFDGFEGDVALGAEILRQALSAPFIQIAENTGRQGAVIADQVLREKSKSYGFNADTGEFGDLIEAGVIDPCKVTTTALTNAASVATVLVSTNCLIADVKDEDEGEEHHHDHDM